MKTISSRFVAIIATAFLVVSLLPATSAYAAAPKNVSAPAVSGIARIGATLSGSQGTWTASPAPTVTSSWYSCSKAVSKSVSALPSVCSVIPGATSTSFVPTAAHKGKYISFAVTQTNILGSATRWSPSTIAITAAPVNTLAPEIEGTSGVGNTLTVNVGTWVGTPAPTFKYAWYQCKTQVPNAQVALASGCSAISRATASTYVIPSTYKGKFILARVTASNSGGSAVIHSASTDAVGTPPTNTVAPSVSGTPEVGVALTGLPGTWSSTTETTRSVTWLACPTALTTVQKIWPANCASIDNYSYTFTPSSEHAGKFISFSVQEINSAGSSLAISISTTAVKSPPVNLVEPTISGIPVVGQTLIGSIGTWVASPSATTTLAWLRCYYPIQEAVKPTPDSPTDWCGPIPGATGNRYVVTEADTGNNHYLSLRVTQVNSAGSSSMISRSLMAGYQSALALKVPASIQFEQDSLYRLRARTGTWEGFPKPTTLFQWFTCTNEQLETSNYLPSGCEAIVGQTSNSFVASDGDIGRHFVLRVTAKNGLEAKLYYTKSTEVRLRNVVQAGDGHTCVLSANGGVKCWGDNRYGQLGQGNTNDSPYPHQVKLPGKATSMSVGSFHTCVLVETWSPFCWGRNDSGQLGKGNVSAGLWPSKVVGNSTDFVSISAGSRNTCGATFAGEVRCWGSNEFDQLGSSRYEGSPKFPWPLNEVFGISTATQVEVGDSHACALLSSGRTKCWGANANSQLGVNGVENSASWSSATPVFVREPAWPDLPEPTVEIASGSNHTCALLESTEVFCWGASDLGQVGQVGSGSNWIGVLPDWLFKQDLTGRFTGSNHIDASGDHTCVSTFEGSAYCWGSNGYGQLGVGDVPSVLPFSPRPQIVQGATNVLQIEAGGDGSCLSNLYGATYCWGNYGKHRSGTARHAGNFHIEVGSLNPEKVDQTLSGVIDIVRTDSASCALLATGEIWCWGGFNPTPNTGFITSNRGQVPDKYGHVENASKVYFTAGDLAAFPLALTDTNELWQVGYGENSTNTLLLENVAKLVTTGSGTFILTLDGAVFHIGPWGELMQIDAPPISEFATRDINGLLTLIDETGQGYYLDETQGNVIVATPTLPNRVKSMSAPYESVICALLVDASLWCWNRFTSEDPQLIAEGVQDIGKPQQGERMVLLPLPSFSGVYLGRLQEMWSSTVFETDINVLNTSGYGHLIGDSSQLIGSWIAGNGKASLLTNISGPLSFSIPELQGIKFDEFSAVSEQACWIDRSQRFEVWCSGRSYGSGSPEGVNAYIPIPIF